ncbi:isopentenyl-diphosphate Delta-isomerase [Microbacterium terricola]|uniref:Isopentenyl-diphosphate Delta-isomerase n=1 Tax=Microbacterium terricola TaxID=344163 RepID=A0ABM8DZC9_9MICO|nr:isopentenyl-diphosphate Delta-isomerase [Microbacterium terricola]UYK41248.1 isopentenyl-diphosphate Delta-isomerase [Microbacterium terricola]BDV30974.1 isopentenyl-diphosphate Delta-isomerase [Microbacterium terricola]
MTTPLLDTDQVVLLDDEGREIGSAPKASIHGTETALHLAFSCHVLDDQGRVLVTRRALGKTTWPGVWSNSFCGHPRPAEPLIQAVRRRAEYELGLELDDIELALPLFRYRATDASGIVEHEICPVYIARTRAQPVLNPLEVAESRWVAPEDLAASLQATPWAFSPWLVLQANQLRLFGAADTGVDNGVDTGADTGTDGGTTAP